MTKQVSISRMVWSDLRDRMLEAIFECEPDAIINYISNSKTLTKIEANKVGLDALIHECEITMDLWLSEYAYDKSNTEALQEYNRWERAKAKLEKINQ